MRSELGYIPLEGQQELRTFLTDPDRADNEIRTKVIDLLNPREARVIYLTDEQFQKGYRITTPNNYELNDTWFDDIHAIFDGNHGLYVARQHGGVEERRSV